MNAMVVEERLTIFYFQGLGFQTSCLPYAKNVISVIDSHMPAMAVVRNEALQETMRVGGFLFSFILNIFSS